jgi:hypothetical protein
MATFKFKARQANSICLYKNLKLRVMKCNGNIYFNWQCLAKKIIPHYTEIRIAHTSPAAINTQNKIQFQCIKDRIKFLYKIKQPLNLEFYQAHLKVAHD